MQLKKKIGITVASVAILGGFGYGLRCAVHSPLFLLRVIEVADQSEPAPIDADRITALAAVPIGSLNLFDLDLSPVEHRLLSNPWIREVRLQKRFPQTLAISVTFREARALVQRSGSQLAYVDVDGVVFGQVNLARQLDLPMFSGFGKEPRERLVEALKLLDQWKASALAGLGQVDSVSYDPERGYRALVGYPCRHGVAHTMVDLGHEFDGDFPAQLGRLHQVFKYLADNGVPVRQIWADSGKKIVVKIARGS